MEVTTAEERSCRNFSMESIYISPVVQGRNEFTAEKREKIELVLFMWQREEDHGLELGLSEVRV